MLNVAVTPTYRQAVTGWKSYFVNPGIAATSGWRHATGVGIDFAHVYLESDL